MLSAPFVNAYDEAMARLFRKDATPVDLIIRHLFAHMPRHVIAIAYVLQISGVYGVRIDDMSVLVKCGIVDDAWSRSPRPWGFYFPYFVCVGDGLALCDVFHLVTQ